MMKKSVLRTIGYGLVAIVLLLSFWVFWSWRRSLPVDLTRLTASDWRDDLRYLADELSRRHANVFHRINKEHYWQLVKQIDSAIPSLKPFDVPVYLEELTAAVGDAHTYLALPEGQHFYPFGVFYFGSEPRVTRATPEFRRILGWQLLKIGDVSMREVEIRLNRILTAGENTWYYRAHYPWFLSKEVLHALGIVGDDEKTTFTFADVDGNTMSLAMSPSAATPPNWVRPYKRAPLYLDKADDDFWFAPVSSNGDVFVGFNSYRKLQARARKLFEYLDSHSVRRLIIDLRNNSGGDYTVGQKSLIDPLLVRPAMMRRGRLYVITGRFTFSAGMNNAAQFRTETHAILVGEPPGEAPNSYQERRSFRLPRSHLLVNYSTRYYKFLPSDTPALFPDKMIEPDWNAYQEGRDAALEWILTQPFT